MDSLAQVQIVVVARPTFGTLIETVGARLPLSAVGRYTGWPSPHTIRSACRL
jgi:hypothetical protein